jgi:hypothetical protein
VHKGLLLDLLRNILQLLEGEAACRSSHEQALLRSSSCHAASQH